MRLVLASGSKTRKRILDQLLGFECEIVKSTDEELSTKTDLSEYVMELSKIKANSASKQLTGEKCLIIAADTIICLDNHKFEKPKSKKEAFENIKKFSGKINHAMTGVTIKDLYQNKEVTFFDKTEVHFKDVSDEDIEWYVNTDPHILERAGYSMADGKASIFVEKIVGDYYNIIGLPLGKLYDNLRALGYSMKDFMLSKD